MPYVGYLQRIPVRPDKQELLDGPMERCAHCQTLWPSVRMVETDQPNRPPRVCPNGDSPTTDVNFEAAYREQAAEEIEFLIAYPRVSIAQMELTIPSTVTQVEDEDGNAVNGAHPLAILRNGTAVIVLRGVNFTAGDTITMPAGISVTSSVRTSTTRTLTLLAAVDAPRGQFSITFNDDTLKSVLQVR